MMIVSYLHGCFDCSGECSLTYESRFPFDLWPAVPGLGCILPLCFGSRARRHGRLRSDLGRPSISSKTSSFLASAA